MFISRIPLAFLVAAPLLAGIVIGKLRGIPFFMTSGEYSIGIYVGDSPFNLKPHPEASNPVMKAGDVTDISADFVADPFMLEKDGQWYLFFEILNSVTKQGDIGVAGSSDGVHWNYNSVVLDEPFHLSYPYVFQSNGEYYLIPESRQAFSVRLYKADNFPYGWKLVKNLFWGNFSDPCLVHYGGYWWIFVSDDSDVMRLFYSESLEGEWREHPQSPVVVRDRRMARGGGRIITVGDTLVRFAQDCSQSYGKSVDAYLITELTPQKFSEVPYPGNPLLEGSGKGWNARRMHNLDPHRVGGKKWIASVDGWTEHTKFGLKY